MVNAAGSGDEASLDEVTSYGGVREKCYGDLSPFSAAGGNRPDVYVGSCGPRRGVLLAHRSRRLR